MPRIISNVLNTLLYEPNARFTAAEVADVCEVSTSMIYKVASDDAELSMNKVARLSRFLCENGDTRLVDCFLSPDLRVCTRDEAKADGRIDDEAADLFSAGGRVVEAHRKGSGAEMDTAISDAQKALDNMRAERDRL